MDVSFWGPSGWKLFHLITFERGQLSAKKKLFESMKDILPCKYCRESARQFMKELPFDNNLAVWLYKFHDKVNDKLRNQHSEDPKIPDPVPSPSFKEVIQTYKDLLINPPTEIPGKDFLLSMAYNYTPDKKECHERFWTELIKVYPHFRKQIRMPDFTSQQTYFQSVHTMMNAMIRLPTIQEVREKLSHYKSGCKRGKTCRKRRHRYKTRRLAPL